VVSQRHSLFHRRPAVDLQDDQRLTADVRDDAAGFLHIGILLNGVEVGFDDLKFRGGQIAVEDLQILDGAAHPARLHQIQETHRLTL